MYVYHSKKRHKTPVFYPFVAKIKKCFFLTKKTQAATYKAWITGCSDLKKKCQLFVSTKKRNGGLMEGLGQKENILSANFLSCEVFVKLAKLQGGKGLEKTSAIHASRGVGSNLFFIKKEKRIHH